MATDVSVKAGSMNGGVLGALSREWFARPPDERITGKDSMDARKNLREKAQSYYDSSKAIVVSTHKIEVQPLGEQGLVLRGEKNPAAPSFWATTQICQRAGVPAGYIRDGLKNNADLAARCLNYGLRSRADDRVGLLLTNRDGALQVGACTGPDYGRVWNKDVILAVDNYFDDQWTVPGIFGKAVSEITKENTSLFLSAQDMFIGLADETRKIEIPNRRNGKPGMLSRAVLVGNSEVGAGTLKIWAFLYDYACANRNFWGVEDFVEVTIRHTSGAPSRFVREAQASIRKFLNASTAKTVEVLKLAQMTKIPYVEKFLAQQKFTRSAANAIIEVHKQEEQRPIETLWDANVGVTAYARRIEQQDERLKIERMAADFMPRA